MKFNDLLLAAGLIISIGLSQHALADENPQMIKKLNAIKNKLNTPAAAASQQTQSQNNAPDDVNIDPNGTSNIQFDKNTIDIGQVGPDSRHEFTFNFKNTGTNALIIKNIHAPCGCTVPNMKKKQYAPGESGEMDVKFHASKNPGSMIKHIYVYTNDPKNPKYELDIKCNVVLKVSAQPDVMNLSLTEENAGAEPIVLKSLDGQKFSVTSVETAGKVAQVDFDKNKKDTSFTLSPKFDTEQLKKRPNGTLVINLTHPDCKTVMVRYTTPPAIVVSPRAIIQTKATPGESYKRTVWITSNYTDKIEIESIDSKKGTVKVVDKEAYGNRYKIDVELTGPKDDNLNKRFHSDELYIKTKDGENITIRCQQWYPKEN